ncbi:hypothetical protein ABLB90_20840 [Photorhabdus bodei]|uniref:hypothetical protein n=1 Tax=Photorhabdus TaxID=29487 RepID=UPI0032B70FB2
MTGVSECSQQRGNLKDDGYKYVLSECDKTGVNKNHVLSVTTVLKLGKKPQAYHEKEGKSFNH